jgi:uncharacterized protein (UPF0332 family)
MGNKSSKLTEEHFKLAERFLKTAKLAKEAGDLRSAADRAYYAMYHAAVAALYEKGIVTKTHKGLHHQFNKEYIKEGLIDKELGGSLIKAFELHQGGVPERCCCQANTSVPPPLKKLVLELNRGVFIP